MLAADDSGVGRALLETLDAIEIVYCQTWQYDDAVARLADRLGCSPARRYYSGIGGTTPQVLVQDAATRILAGEVERVLVVGAEALATQARLRKQGETYAASFRRPRSGRSRGRRRSIPVEVAHDVFSAWLTFAMFDNARRAHLGIGLAEYRREIAEMMAPMTEIAAANPNAWFPIARTVDDILTPRPDNRMVGYPYTKYMVAVMDVDMAAARADDEPRGSRPTRCAGRPARLPPRLVLRHRPDLRRRAPRAVAVARDGRGERRGVPRSRVSDRRRRALRPVQLLRELAELRARRARASRADDARPLTVTGGLPYHGGPASNYMGHAIATMVDTLRADPGAFGLVSGVGMHMTKHVFGLYSDRAGPGDPPDAARTCRPGSTRTRSAEPGRPRRRRHRGGVLAWSTAATASPSRPCWSATCADGARTYAKMHRRRAASRWPRRRSWWDARCG